MSPLVGRRPLLAAGLWLAWIVVVGSLCAAEGVSLTTDEQAWIAAHPRIRVGYDPAWPPFSTRGEKGELVGIDADVLALLGRRLGLTFETATRADWPAVYGAAKAGEFDVLSSVALTPEREGEFRFTRPYLSFPLVIITRGGAPVLWTLEDLRDRSVAAPRDYAPTLMLQRLLPGLRLRLTGTTQEALRLVSEGEVDATLTNLPNVSFVIKTSGYTNLMIAGVAPETLDLRFAIRRDWPELAGLLDKGIATITPEDRQAFDHRWIRVDYANVVRWDVVWKTAALVVGVLGVVIAAIAYRNRLLSRELAERNRLHAAIEASHRELAQLHDEKSALLQMAAHDLRSPLTSMQLTLDSVSGLSMPLATALPILKSSTRSMVDLLNNLLDLEEIEEGQRKWNFEPLAVRPVLDASLELHRPAATRKKITFAVTGPATLPRVRADAHALRQIFDNLVSNAVKYSPLDRAIRIDLALVDANLRIAITNDGSGVPPGETERIFTKYHRGPARPTAGERSVGLGLSIVRSVANAMNGRVWCESVPGESATFIVLLPAESAQTAPSGRA